MPNLYSIIDIETTGGNPKVDRITEIAIFLHDGEKVIDSFISLVNPMMPIPDFISRMTGIDNEMVSEAPKFYEIARQVVEMTEGSIFVAHNVRFDYSFIQKEFRQLGYTYSRKQLCTVKLARKLMPGDTSYSLKNLCKRLGITNEASHRAWGDARATTTLFEILLQKEKESFTEELISQELSISKLPPNISKSVVDGLPEETGVYYFLGKNAEILYVGKSNNIRKRIYSHFQGAHKAIRSMQMLDQIHDISYELTGSELIALLLENEEIKRIQPHFNRAQRRKQYKFGVYTRANKKGYLEFYVDPYDEEKYPIAGFSGRAHALSSLKRRGKKYELCPKLYGLEKGPGRCFHHQLHICRGACCGEEHAESYNERVRLAIQEINYGKNNLGDFLIVGEGRNYDERSIVMVQKGLYKGYAYVDASYMQQGLDTLIDSITYKDETPDVQRIIQGYIKKHPKEVVRIS
ncbi:MAG: exonuclease domain-containing protein [Bacteroidia bacterium]|nr:exonuclease domain-containing protein [Bacteroidia bacterium]